MRKLLTGFVFILCGTVTFAQTKTPIGFDSYNAVGFLAGKSPLAFTAQTVNGLRFNKWFVGAGLGIDEYFISSFPIFLDVRRDIIHGKKLRLFLYGDFGAHFITKDKGTENGFTSKHSKGTLYLDAGLALKLNAGKTNHFFLSFGNTMKKIECTEWGVELSMPVIYSAVYKLHRLSVRAGFQF